MLRGGDGKIVGAMSEDATTSGCPHGQDELIRFGMFMCRSTAG